MGKPILFTVAFVLLAFAAFEVYGASRVARQANNPPASTVNANIAFLTQLVQVILNANLTLSTANTNLLKNLLNQLQSNNTAVQALGTLLNSTLTNLTSIPDLVKALQAVVNQTSTALQPGLNALISVLQNNQNVLNNLVQSLKTALMNLLALLNCLLSLLAAILNATNDNVKTVNKALTDLVNQLMMVIANLASPNLITMVTALLNAQMLNSALAGFLSNGLVKGAVQKLADFLAGPPIMIPKITLIASASN